MPLDASMIARAVPPGSMRQLAILFSPAPKRAVLEALYVIESEVFGSARNTSHDVAHTRLQWWRAEIDRLVNGTAQHPATQVLLALSEAPDFDARELHEMLVAADMDLAHTTYESPDELAAYARRAGGVIQVIGARWLAAPALPAQSTLDAAMRFGGIVRQIEAIRDLRRDTRDGRLYVAVDELDRAGLDIEQLTTASVPDALRTLLADWHRRLSAELSSVDAAVDHAERPSLRHAIVLARLHARLLSRLQRRHFDAANQRFELGPIERVFTAWRAARTTT